MAKKFQQKDDWEKMRGGKGDWFNLIPFIAIAAAIGIPIIFFIFVISNGGGG